MAKRCSALVLIGVLAGCSPEQPAAPPAQSGPVAAQPESSSEQLLAEPPADWQQSFRTEGPGIRLVEYVPPATDAAEWAEKLSFESFNDAPLPDPAELLTSIANDQRKTCEKFEDHETFSGTENGYPTAVRLFVCYVNPLTNKGQLTLVKTIKGDSHFYVITRARRVAPIELDGESPIPPKTMAEWSLYLRAISVCNIADPTHPCPAPPASSTPAPAAAEAPAPASSE
jgi:hypothetical protein